MVSLGLTAVFRQALITRCLVPRETSHRRHESLASSLHASSHHAPRCRCNRRKLEMRACPARPPTSCLISRRLSSLAILCDWCHVRPIANTQHFRASARACPASHAQFSHRTAILRVVILRSRRKAPCSSARSRSLLAFAHHVRYAERSASRSKRRWAMPFTTFISILTTLFSTANWLAMLMTCNSRILALGDGRGGKERAVLPALVIRVGAVSRFLGNRETKK